MINLSRSVPRFFVALLALPNLPVAAQPFVDLATPEFQVNTHVPGDQRVPHVAADGTGRSVVVWQSLNQDDPGWSVFAQRLDAMGEALGNEFRVNVFSEGLQDGQRVAMLPDGRFAVTWNGPDRTSESAVIQMRRFDAQGVPLGGDRRVSDDLPQLQILPVIGLLESGATVVAWDARRVIGTNFNVVARYFDANEQPLSPVRAVNQFRDSAQYNVAMAMNLRGDKVVAWQSAGQDGDDWGVFARCMSFGGVGGDEFQVNQTSQGSQSQPRVAIREDGQFAVVWQDTTGLPSIQYRRIMVRLFDADCQPLGGEIQANQFDEGLQDLPEISIDGHGVYVLVWQSFPPRFVDQGIYGRRLSPDGHFLGDEFRISQEVEAYQDFPAVAGLPDGGFLATWETLGQDGSGFGIYARRFFGPAMTAILVESGADQLLVAEQPLPEPLVVRAVDQWGQARPGERLRFKAPEQGPGVQFEGGLRVVERISDEQGRVLLTAVAGPLPGPHAVIVEAADADVSTRIELRTQAPAVPVPLAAGWAWLLLVLAVLLPAWLALGPRRL
ncbi:MAG: hypothetical protein JJU31_16165 [Wenzhouxiangella sp.]|nr:hypothetical protein [Wenzhouxiangella sp.]